MLSHDFVIQWAILVALSWQARGDEFYKYQKCMMGITWNSAQVFSSEGKLAFPYFYPRSSLLIKSLSEQKTILTHWLSSFIERVASWSKMFA